MEHLNQTTTVALTLARTLVECKSERGIDESIHKTTHVLILACQVGAKMVTSYEGEVG